MAGEYGWLGLEEGDPCGSVRPNMDSTQGLHCRLWEQLSGSVNFGQISLGLGLEMGDCRG